MQIMYNAVKRLRDGLASRHLSALSAIPVYSTNVTNWVEVRRLPSIPCWFSSNISFFLDKYSSTSFWQRLWTEFLRQKSFKYHYVPSPSCFAVILFCLFFFNHIVFTYWMVSICLYCCPFTPSRGVAINVFLAGIIIRLTNKNNVIVQIGYFTVFWKENIHGNKYVNQNIYIKKTWSIFNCLKFLFHVFFCFVLLESSSMYAETPNAFIFSLNNSERLAPFVSKVKKDKTAEAIYRDSQSGPVFGNDLSIYLNEALVQAILVDCYSVPRLVKDNLAILDGHQDSFSPDDVEVFYLDPSR